MADKCTNCKKEFGFFRWRFTCPECRKDYCSECFKAVPELKWLCTEPLEYLNKRKFFLKDDSVCESCWTKKVESVEKKYQEAFRKNRKMELVSINYKGTKCKSKSDPDVLMSPWCENKDDARKYLRVTASFLDKDIVTEVEWHKETRDKPSKKGDGTYYYSVWRATGSGWICEDE